MSKLKKRQRVIVAMSGGVDSSVATALLKEAGFNVVGIFLKFWAPLEKSGLIGKWNRCCSPEAEARARKVAKILNIPFYVFNFEKEFKKRIVDYFLKGYRVGRTPNPCVVCNKEIKFGLLLERILKLETDNIATGHYARIKEKGGQFFLLKGKDREKDQSYFLWMLKQKQLKRTLFPIGNYTRSEVERLAKRFKFDFLLKVPKSVEICFVQTTIDDFLKRYLREKPGKIVTKDGKVVGEHRGLWFYTIGQRKGLNLSGGPFYVLDKNLEKNLLIVTKRERDLLKKELICENVNWISRKEPKLPLKIKAKVRYRTISALAMVTPGKEKGTYKVIFEKPQKAITPGQSVVFYKGQKVLGGGIIKNYI